MASEIIPGVDVYAGDGEIIHRQVANAGYRFAYVKATQGHWLRDPLWSPNIIGFRDVGMFVGSYHFFEATWDATAQAQYFLRKVGSHANLVGQLLPCLDVERRGGMSVKQLTDSVVAFCHVIECEVGVKPLLYLNRDYALNQLQSRRLAEYPIWLATWSRSRPRGPWGAWRSCRLWQDRVKATVPGMPNAGECDTDAYYGTWAGLKQMTVR